MNKTNSIILSLVLCFSLAFAVYPLKVFATLTAEELAQIEENLAIVESVNNGTYTPPSETTPSATTGGDDDGNGDDSTDLGYDPNSQGSICDVTAVYEHPEDLDSFPDETWYIGMTFTGTSGTNYIAVAETNSQGGENLVWVPVDEDGGNDNGNDKDKYSCNTSTWTCSEASNGTYSSLAACQNNCQAPVDPSQSQYRCKQCHGSTCEVRYFDSPCAQTCAIDANCAPPVPTTRYSCNTSTWSCFVNPNSIFSLAECRIICQPGGTLKCPGNSYCYACNRSTYQCYHLNSGTYSTLSSCQSSCKPSSSHPKNTTTTTTSPPPKCEIYEFSINGKTNEDSNPLLVWVDSSLKGYISVNDSCTQCTVTSDDTWGNPSQDYTITSLTTYITTDPFKISESGIYSFDIRCVGNPSDPDDFDEDTNSLETVEAINLPWWREIIPVLTGFLGEAWR